MENPVGIEKTDIQLGWQMRSTIIGERQESYRIRVVKCATAALVWDSGEVRSSTSVGIAFGGSADDMTAYSWSVTVRTSSGAQVTSDAATFETGAGSNPQWLRTRFISRPTTSAAAVYFRAERALKPKGKVVSARLYVTSFGVYQAFVNGEAVEYSGGLAKQGEPYMNPGYGNGTVSLGYQTYDITKSVGAQGAQDTHETQGAHKAQGAQPELAVGIVLGTGWFNGMAETSARPMAKVLVRIMYADGTDDYITSNNVAWKCSTNGPIRANGIYYGEDYDARLEALVRGFSEPGFDDSGWQGISRDCFLRPRIHADMRMVGTVLAGYDAQAKSLTVYSPENVVTDVANPGGVIVPDLRQTGSEPSPLEPGTLEPGTLEPGTLAPATSEPGTLAPVALEPGKKLLIDTGQNMSAIPEVTLAAARGVRVSMRFGEMLNDGSVVSNEPTSADGPKGSLYTKNLRNARAAITYVCSGEGIERYRPAMSFFGYRYIEISADGPLVVHAVVSKAVSSVSKRTGFITTNNEHVNRLLLNSVYGQLSNYFTTATDCPQRDERLCYGADTQVFARTAVYNFDSVAFLGGIASIMSENTQICGYLPWIPNDVFQSTCAGWGDAEVVIPWTLYRQSGDEAILSRNWAAMAQLMEWMCGHERGEHQAYLDPEGINCGDWLAFQGTCIEMMADYYYAYDLQIMAAAAKALGKTEENARFSQKFDAVRECFLRDFVDFDGENLLLHSGRADEAELQFGYDGSLEDNSQTALLWFLKLGFATSDSIRAAATRLLIDNIRNVEQPSDGRREKYGKNTLSVGFLGANILLPVVTQAGYPQVAYDLLLQNEQPSWLFEVNAGATTIWERWNSYVPGVGFGDVGMNSFNHYAYGAVCEWMYRFLAGIEAKEPGFSSIVLQPVPDTGEAYNSEARISSVKAEYESYYGRIGVEWRSEQGQIVDYRASIPANTCADLYLPSRSDAVLSGYAFAEIPFGVRYVGRSTRNGLETACFTLQSGSYEFTKEGDEWVIATG
jgi:alpha-L-rhamnosidase